MYPLISIIMPVYNAERFIESSVKSILTQTIKDFELIIIDDGSTDSSMSILKSIKDSRIILFENEKRGISHQLNFGISQARADLIARMDADDISDLDRLKKQYEFLKLNQEIDIVGTNCFLINFKNTKVGTVKYPENHFEIFDKMPVEQCVCHASLLLKKSVFNTVNYCSEFEPAEDHQLFLKMLSLGYKFYNIQENLYSIRSLNHFKNSTKSIIQKKISYRIGREFIIKHCNDQRNYIGYSNSYYKLALLEYNNGFMKSARNNFINYLKFSNNKIFIVIRYIIPSILGDKIFNYLREKNITNKINYIFKKIGIETHRF